MIQLLVGIPATLIVLVGVPILILSIFRSPTFYDKGKRNAKDHRRSRRHLD